MIGVAIWSSNYATANTNNADEFCDQIIVPMVELMTKDRLSGMPKERSLQGMLDVARERKEQDSDFKSRVEYISRMSNEIAYFPSIKLSLSNGKLDKKSKKLAKEACLKVL